MNPSIKGIKINEPINSNGQCQEAFEFYASSLQGEIDTMLQVKGSPISKSSSSDWQNKIVHANISIHGVELAVADVKPKQYQKPKGFYLLLGLRTEDLVESAFSQLSATSEIILPPQKHSGLRATLLSLTVLVRKQGVQNRFGA